MGWLTLDIPWLVTSHIKLSQRTLSSITSNQVYFMSNDTIFNHVGCFSNNTLATFWGYIPEIFLQKHGSQVCLDHYNFVTFSVIGSGPARSPQNIGIRRHVGRWYLFLLSIFYTFMLWVQITMVHLVTAR